MDNKILFYSTNHQSEKVGFDKALLKGQAPDKGLYMPEIIPEISAGELRDMKSLEYPEIASIIIGKFLANVIPGDILEKLIVDAYDFAVPLEHVYQKKYVMRLDQGPTASFKDFAGRMMGRLMNYYVQKNDQKLLILTATSGDTGSAIANAFYGLDKIDVLVLFPVDEVSDRQRKQMTTLGKNIRIIGLDSKFDDCQALVKQAFADPELEHLNLSSANSINIGRLIPQIVYYFFAYSRLCEEKMLISVPSGNFGDMMGGVIAMHMGLPVEKFIIATNENDEFPEFLRTGTYQKIVPSKNCLSSAMNVGHPSNLARLIALYGGHMDEKGKLYKNPDLEKMKQDFFSVSVTDQETQDAINEAWKKYKLLLEPHGAVGWHALMRFLELYPELDNGDQVCISLETAHPAKFPDQIRKILGYDPELPPSLAGLEDKTEKYDKLETDYDSFKKFLLTNY